MHPNAQAIDGGAEQQLIPRAGSHQFHAFSGHMLAQMRLALPGQALGRPALPQAELATAFSAGGHHHTGRPIAQRVFDKGRRQLAGAQQRVGLHIGGLPTADRRTVLARKHHQGVAGGRRVHVLAQARAQGIDRQLRHVDAGRQLLDATKRGGRRAGARADPAADAQVGIDQGQLAPHPLIRMVHHRDRGVGAIHQAAPAAAAVVRIDHRHRGARRLRQERQRQQQRQDTDHQRPDEAARRGVGQRVQPQQQPVEMQFGRHLPERRRRVAHHRPQQRQQRQHPDQAQRQHAWRQHRHMGQPLDVKPQPEQKQHRHAHMHEDEKRKQAVADRMHGEKVARQRRGQQRQQIQPLGRRQCRVLAKLIPDQPEATDSAHETERHQGHAGQPVEATHPALMPMQPFAHDVQQHDQHQHIGRIPVQPAQQLPQAQGQAFQPLDRRVGARHRGIEQDEQHDAAGAQQPQGQKAQRPQVPQGVQCRTERRVESSLERLPAAQTP